MPWLRPWLLRWRRRPSPAWPTSSCTAPTSRTFVTALAGYGLLMVVAQIPLLGRYARLKFSLATWAFTFSWAAVASTLLFWIDAEHVSGGRAFSYLVLAAISVLVTAIACRTVVAISRVISFPTHPTRPCRRQRRPDLGVPKPVCQDFDSSLRHSR